MSAIPAIIVDDELPARENLRILLTDLCPEVSVIDTASNIQEARELIFNKKPRVVFLDIRMPAGAEGFELLESLPSINFQVIFVTAFKEYAIKAFQANAIDYLLKPIDIVELKRAVEKLVETDKLFHKVPESIAEYATSLSQLTANKAQLNDKGRITINHSKGFKIIKVSDIIHLEANGNYTMIFLREGNNYLDTRTLKVYEELLDNATFFRVHKSHIVNLSCVDEYINEDGHFAILNNKSWVPISRNKLPLFMQILKG